VSSWENRVANRNVHDPSQRILILAPTGRDGQLTDELLAQAGLVARVCGTMDELCDALGAGAVLVILAEEVLVPSAITQLGNMLAGQEPWSDLPVILFTGEGATVQSPAPTLELMAPLGNVTLLDRPVRPVTLLSAVQSAMRARRHQYATREALAEEQRAVLERDRFLAMLGHELRNPLGPILLALEVMDRMGAGADASRPRSVIRRQVNQLVRLVDDLLDVSRVTSGKIVLQRSPVELGELVQRCVQAVEPARAAQRLALFYDGPGKPVVVDGDSVRLEQVVMNLAVNAIKYTPAGGRVDISLSDEQGQAVVRVRDSGVGIGPAMLPRVFDMFFQAEQTLDRAKGGMGIGLTLVRRLVELHGGSVEATSPGIGLGSEFVLRLPIVARADLGREPTLPLASAGQHPLLSRRVLIIEDNEDSRETLQLFLEGCGHHVDAAEDGVTGVARAIELKPDILLVDIGLPGMDGYGVARHVREVLGQSVYLVALTGYGQPEDRRLALEAGFDVHFTKPVRIEAVEQLLSRADLRHPPN